jgi:hypothetical protein
MYQTRGKYLLVLANGDYSTFSMTKRNNHIVAGIQAAAQDTLSTGYKYFAVVKPNELSNTQGSKINTFIEFKDVYDASQLIQDIKKDDSYQEGARK